MGFCDRVQLIEKLNTAGALHLMVDASKKEQEEVHSLGGLRRVFGLSRTDYVWCSHQCFTMCRPELLPHLPHPQFYLVRCKCWSELRRQFHNVLLYCSPVPEGDGKYLAQWTVERARVDGLLFTKCRSAASNSAAVCLTSSFPLQPVSCLILMCIGEDARPIRLIASSRRSKPASFMVLMWSSEGWSGRLSMNSVVTSIG